MTVIAHGDRFDAIESFRGFERVEYVYFQLSELSEESVAAQTQKLVHDFWMRWRQPTNPRKNLVLVDPPKGIDFKGLVPKSDRHVVISDPKLLAPWQAWARSHKNQVDVVKHAIVPQALIGLLVEGDVDEGIPRFRKNAAEHLVQAYPGGLFTLAIPIAALKAREVKVPVSLEDVLELCPLVGKGQQYAVSAVDLIKGLGTSKAVELAGRTPEKQAYGPLIYALKKYNSEVTEIEAVHPGSTEVRKNSTRIACPGYENRVTFLEAVIRGIEEKKWNPRAGLVLFAYLCLLEGACPSTSVETSSFSPALRTLSQLSNMSL